MSLFDKTRVLLEDVNILLVELEKSKEHLPAALNEPYTVLYMILDTLRYRDEVYTGFILMGMDPLEAATSTSEAIKSKSQELLDSTKPNVIPFKKKDN
jgi:hypothetical protein